MAKGKKVQAKAKGQKGASKVKASRGFFGHPKGLAVLFLTEMWERFSYYGMRSLLVLYMVNYLFINPDLSQTVWGYNWVRATLEGIFGPLAIQAFASQIYGLYTGLVYATPFFGGILADRFIGQRRAVVLGGVLMIFGHFLMAIESAFFVALFFIILGNGAFKPNISTQVGDLYEADDPRRDGAFTIFYMGINLGAFFSPLICGTLGQKVGWHWGFGAAGVGMAIGLVVYLWGQKYLAPAIEPQSKQALAAAKVPFTATERKAIWALVALCVLNIVFWGVYEQQGNTMQLWADNNTDWNFLGYEIPSSWYQSFNPFTIFVFAPLLSLFWKKQAANGNEPTSVTKMGIGCLLLAVAFCVMILAAKAVPPDQRGTVLWLAATTLFLTIGELYLSPIGLSLVTKVSPKGIVSMMMGMWFLSSFIGNYLSGYLGSFYEMMDKTQFFGLMAVLAAGAGLAMLAFNKPLRSALGNH